MRRTKRLITSLVLAILVALGMGVVVAPAAQAASVGYVYISFPTWLANCPKGGNATIIWADDNLQTWNADAGDDLIYGKVWLNQWNSVQYTLYCNKGPGYYQPGLSTSFVPTRNNQTIWVGPAGWSRN